MAKKSVRLNDAKPEEWDAVADSVSEKEAVISDEWDINKPKDLLHWINRVIDKKVYIYISSINDFTRYEEVVGRIASR